MADLFEDATEPPPDLDHRSAACIKAGLQMERDASETQDTELLKRGRALVTLGQALASGPRGPVRDDEDFDWTYRNKDIIVPAQRALAIYRNVWGQVALKEERGPLDSEDVHICINPECLPDVIERLTQLKDELLNLSPPDRRDDG